MSDGRLEPEPQRNKNIQDTGNVVIRSYRKYETIHIYKGNKTHAAC